MTLWDKAYREVDAGASRSDHAEAPARRALLAGVIASGVLLSAGLLAVLIGRESRPDLPPSGRELLSGLLHFRGSAMLYLGLLILAATPVLRVAVMVGVYLRRRESFVLVVSLLVLFLLCLGLLLGTG